MTLRAASCFSGIGAPEMGGPQFDWLWCAEVEPFPCEVLATRFPHSVNLGDVTADDFIERAKAFGRLDLLVGGPPCQAFSIAGLRQSLADDRGNLSLRFLEITHAIRPRNLLVENVPGWLNTPDNAFGCFLAGLVGADDALPAPDGGSWPSAGMVAGPRARAAWRVLDAQYFGVAQRRRRVFVVADFGDGADPAAVLFERQGLLGNPPPRREAGQGTAGTLSARTEGGGGLGTDFELGGGLQPVSVGFGGGNTSGPIEMAACLTAKGQRVDFEVETFIAHTLTGNGFDASEDGTGRGTPIIPIDMRQASRGGTMTNNRGEGQSGGAPGTGIGDVGDPAPSLSTSHVPAVAGPIAFSSKDYGNDATDNLSPTLRSRGHNASHANGGGQMAVAIQAGALRENPNSGPDGVGVQQDVAYTLEARAEVRQMDIAGALAAEPGMKQQTYVALEPYTLAERGREGGANLEYRNDGTSNTILTPSGGRGGIGVGAIATAWQVRRLTVRECERLQGFPDGFTLIETSKRRTIEADMGAYLADQGAIVTNGNDGKIRTNAAADGPRYKALGNSWAVPCGAWILARLATHPTARSAQ